ncbi:hypothetical protein SNEBB_011399, partial [Seison nebaliae]
MRMLQKFDDTNPLMVNFGKEYFGEVDEITKRLPFYNKINGIILSTITTRVLSIFFSCTRTTRIDVA